MNLTIYPGRALRGAASLPGDKSLSHRAALLAALAQGESRIENFLVSGVTQAMLDALSVLGVRWVLEGTTLSVWGEGLARLTARFEGREPVYLYCGNSATTLRLLAGALTAAGVSAILDGSAGLRRRPMGRIVEPLNRMGAGIGSTGGCAPLILRRRDARLIAHTHHLEVASAQVKSCLLLASLAASGPVTVIEPGPSRDHTERMLQGMGVEVIHKADPKPGAPDRMRTELSLPKRVQLAPLRLALPGDFSSAAFLLAAAVATPGSQVTLVDIGLNPTRTGLLDALREMGAEIQTLNISEQGGEPVGSLSAVHSRLHAAQVSGPRVVRMIDEFPAFAAAAAYAAGQTAVSEALELRHKESDRISVLCEQLRRLGVDAAERPDGFVITGGEVPGGAAVNSCGDHRLAMALAVTGLAARMPVTVEGAEIIYESYPRFVETLEGLDAQVKVWDA